ncbi:phosphotransferase [Pseudactinotalea sp. Z1739]|uniref:phosphotransferase n=1 Tax=Pseudactinotalea sp. Z1739 TaxID=3413028 RepID=UPI003C7D4416
MSLELLGPAGELLAGQLIEDDGDRRRVMAATSAGARAGADVLVAPALDGRGAEVGTVLVQARGADRRLQALPHLLTEPGSHLLVHRPERRAVGYLPGGPEVVAGAGAPDQAPGAGTYARVFRPGRTAAVVRSARLGVHVLGGLPGFAAPAVLEHREGDGVVVTSSLPGESLRALLGTEQGAAVLRAGAAGLGHLLRHLAGAPVPRDLPVRDAAAELAWVGVWIERVRHHLPRIHSRLPAGLELIADHLDRRPATGAGIIHGDLHDGQVLISRTPTGRTPTGRTPTGRTPTGPALDDDTASVGVLDWDTVAVGEGALDAANVWAHTDLRRLLGHWPADSATDFWTTVVEHWDPAPAELDRATAYRRLLLLRLACQYAFRPAHAHVTQDLLALAMYGSADGRGGRTATDHYGHRGMGAL